MCRFGMWISIWIRRRRDGCASLNDGNRVTPTVIVGDDVAVEAEPTLEALGELPAAAGYDVGPAA